MAKSKLWYRPRRHRLARDLLVQKVVDYGPNRRALFTGYKFCRQYGWYDDAKKLGNRVVQDRNSSTFRCQANHTSFCFPTEKDETMSTRCGLKPKKSKSPAHKSNFKSPSQTNTRSKAKLTYGSSSDDDDSDDESGNASPVNHVAQTRLAATTPTHESAPSNA